MLKLIARKHHGSGFTLIEVLIGILIFAVGMMALAKLQGNLARNSGDSNARTVATNIAEEIIERARVFQNIDSGGGFAAYNDIVDGTTTIERSGNLFTVVTDVTDYYYDAALDEFTVDVPIGAGPSNFKQIDLTVTWNSGQEFQVDAINTTNGQLGSGSIRITDVVSSMPSGSGGKAGLSSVGDSSYAPPVNYNPGQNPDIVSIELAANKFKESTTPLPKVFREDALVETTFDVVTYSQSTSGATFLRREEFRALSCECKLRVPDPLDTSKGGKRPTIWEGYDYTEGEFVSKTYGESAYIQSSDVKQSQYCDLCCRDHHDGGTGEADVAGDPGRYLYNPFPSDGYNASGDHNHYGRDRDGILVLADSDGDVYTEACRMIRKDGFWRIAQDLRQVGLNSFPGYHLDEPSEVDEYSDYVTNAISDFEAAMAEPSAAYETTLPLLTKPAMMTPAVVFPASTVDNPTIFAEDGTTVQQLRARGIYLDYMSDVLRGRINCLDDKRTDCDVPDVQYALEIIPFYDVQLTWLARWNETPTNYPIDVSNDAIANDNSHDRGKATLTGGTDDSAITSAVHRGNLGLTGTDPIDKEYLNDEAEYILYATSNDNSTPPVLSGLVVSGTITSSLGYVKATDVEILATGALCGRTNTGFSCEIIFGAANPRITVSNYFKADRFLVACSSVLSTNGTEHSGTNPANNWTRFNLPMADVGDANIVIRLDSCN